MLVGNGRRARYWFMGGWGAEEVVGLWGFVLLDFVKCYSNIEVAFNRAVVKSGSSVA